MRKSKIKTIDVRMHVGVSCAFAYRDIEGILVANNEADLKAMFIRMCGDDCEYDQKKSADVVITLDKKRNENKEAK